MRLDTNQALSAQDCWELLPTQTVGRPAVSIRALPAIVPVQYYVDSDLIAICLGHYQVPTGTINNAVAAFGVDNLANQPLSPGWTRPDPRSDTATPNGRSPREVRTTRRRPDPTNATRGHHRSTNVALPLPLVQPHHASRRPVRRTDCPRSLDPHRVQSSQSAPPGAHRMTPSPRPPAHADSATWRPRTTRVLMASPFT
jgi:hypothetical protein